MEISISQISLRNHLFQATHIQYTIHVYAHLNELSQTLFSIVILKTVNKFQSYPHHFSSLISTKSPKIWIRQRFLHHHLLPFQPYFFLCTFRRIIISRKNAEKVCSRAVLMGFLTHSKHLKFVFICTAVI